MIAVATNIVAVVVFLILFNSNPTVRYYATSNDPNRQYWRVHNIANCVF